MGLTAPALWPGGAAQGADLQFRVGLTSQVCFDSMILVIRWRLLLKGSFCGSTEDFLPGSGTEAATGSSGIETPVTCCTVEEPVSSWAPPRHQRGELTPPDNSPEWGSNLRRSTRATTSQNSHVDSFVPSGNPEFGPQTA